MFLLKAVKCFLRIGNFKNSQKELMISNKEHNDQVMLRPVWLVAGFIRNTLTEDEHDELDDWINENDENMQLFEIWTEEDDLDANLQWMDTVTKYEKPKDLNDGESIILKLSIKYIPGDR